MAKFSLLLVFLGAVLVASCTTSPVASNSEPRLPASTPYGGDVGDRTPPPQYSLKQFCSVYGADSKCDSLPFCRPINGNDGYCALRPDSKQDANYCDGQNSNSCESYTLGNCMWVRPAGECVPRISSASPTYSLEGICQIYGDKTDTHGQSECGKVPFCRPSDGNDGYCALKPDSKQDAHYCDGQNSNSCESYTLGNCRWVKPASCVPLRTQL